MENTEKVLYRKYPGFSDQGIEQSAKSEGIGKIKYAQPCKHVTFVQLFSNYLSAQEKHSDYVYPLEDIYTNAM